MERTDPECITRLGSISGHSRSGPVCSVRFSWPLAGRAHSPDGSVPRSSPRGPQRTGHPLDCILLINNSTLSSSPYVFTYVQCSAIGYGMLLHLKALRDAPEPGPIPHHVEAPPSLSPSSGAKACFGPSSAASSSFSASSSFVAFRRTFEDSARRRRPVPRASWSFRLTSWTLPQRTLRKTLEDRWMTHVCNIFPVFCLSHIHSHPFFARLSVLLSSDMMHHDAVSGSSCVACIRRVSRSVPRVRSR
jgi:hypothetical protein